MSIEVIAAGLIGISGTLLGVLADHFLNGRRESQKARLENWNNAVREVYSPLIFDLRLIKDRGTLRELRTLGMTLPKLSKAQTNEQLTIFTTFILRAMSQNQSTLLRETLRKNSGLIRPQNLWDDLFFFYHTLNFLEDSLSMFSTGLVGNNPDMFMAEIQSFIRIGAKLDESTEHFVDGMTQLALLDKPPTALNYSTFFTEDVRKAHASELVNARTFMIKGKLENADKSKQK
jgi:hypothetical protein